MTQRPFGWLDIIRLGLVQTALGAVVVLTTSTLNRVMVVEYALPAMAPGCLVALHHAIQMLRPRWGYHSDRGGRRTPWIVGGMAILGAGGFAAAIGTALMGQMLGLGLAIAFCGFVMIGVGAGAAGTSLLVLLAQRVEPGRRAAAATIVWVMMIGGFVITAVTAGHFLDPFSPARLVTISGCVSLAAFAVAALAIWRIEGPAAAMPAQAGHGGKHSFGEALRQVWKEDEARTFTIFVFVSMLAYSMQELIVEPYGGAVFAMSPGTSTKLAGLQHGGVLMGMIAVAVAGSLFMRQRAGYLRACMILGCLASALSLLAVSAAGLAAPLMAGISFPAFLSHLQTSPLHPPVLALGFFNGVFAVAAIGSMMALATNGRNGRDGTRMGLWGAAQAVAFGAGGLVGTVLVDAARVFSPAPAPAYMLVFTLEALLFVYSAALAARLGTGAAAKPASLHAALPQS